MRRICKATARAIASIAMCPAVGMYYLGAAVLGQQKAFAGWSQAVSLIPGITGEYLRVGFYGWVLPECGVDACISFGTVFSHPTARIGPKVYTGLFCCLGDITLEEDVLLGSHVSIANGSRQHGIDRIDIPIREQPGEWPRVTIGRDAWIGDRACVLADVGRHCVVGAGSVVTQPIPDYAIAVGVPAKVVRYRDQVASDTDGIEQTETPASIPSVPRT